MSTAPEFPVTAPGYHSVLSDVIERRVGPQAVEIDRTGAFPRDSVQALGDAGLLGLVSAPQVGGGGESLAAAAQVIETVAARCPSTSPVSGVGVVVPAGARLGDDGAGRDIALATVLPSFLVLNAALSLGIMEALVAEAGADGVLRLCGGAAFRKELGVERLFRDALAARVMAPTTDALHDLVGRVCLGLPLFDADA